MQFIHNSRTNISIRFPVYAKHKFHSIVKQERHQQQIIINESVPAKISNIKKLKLTRKGENAFEFDYVRRRIKIANLLDEKRKQKKSHLHALMTRIVNQYFRTLELLAHHCRQHYFQESSSVWNQLFNVMRNSLAVVNRKRRYRCFIFSRHWSHLHTNTSCHSRKWTKTFHLLHIHYF